MTDEQTEAMAERIDKLARKLDLVCETPSVLAALEQLDAIEAAIAAGEERLAAIAQQEAALQQREAELDQRERDNKVREFQFDQKRNEAMSELRSNYLALAQSDRSLKMRILNYSGMLAGFNPSLQALPDWSAIQKMLGVSDAIAELQDTPTELTREGTTGDAFVPGSTLTRSMPMAAMASHDDQPMLRPPRPPAGARRRARRGTARRVSP